MSIALIPLIVAGTYANRAIQDRMADERAATEVMHRLDTIGMLMQLRLHFDEEILPSQASLQGAAFGVSADDIGQLLGFDIAESIVTARTSVDNMIGRIEAVDVVDLTRAQALLAEMRTGIDNATLTPTELRETVSRINAEVNALADSEVAMLDNGLHDAGVESATEQLTAVYQLVDASNRQMPMLFDVLLGGLAGGSGTSLIDLAEVTGWYRVTAERFDAELTGAPEATWRTLRSNPSSARFDRAVDGLLSGGSETIAPTDLTQLAGLVSSGFARSLAHFNVFEAASADASAAARLASEEATNELERYTLGVVLMVVATVGLLALVTRSIRRPLRRLARVAERVNTGNLAGVKVPPPRGPREVRVVGAAFADLVDGLKIVAQQTDALAAGDLDAPALAVHMPGQLGTSLRESVRTLSTSMSERDRLYAQLRHEATHDSVTGLPNRSALLDNISGALERYRGRVASLGLLVIQLDGLRRANDVHGHDVGDAVLGEAGRRLTAAAAGYAEVARLGDDEFIVVAEDETLSELTDLGERIVAAFASPVEVSGRVLYVTACVGIARAVDASTTRAELMRGASIAARRARTLGQRRVEVFNDDLRGVLARSAELERELATALSAGELTFELQPVWDLTEHRASGFEALARWTRPDGTKVSPADFIAAAELSDLVIELDNFVMMSAAKTIAGWNAVHDTEFSIAVNVSGRHLLTRRVIDDVRHALEVTGLRPDLLVIEITETVVLTDLEIATGHLAELRGLGVRIAIDDFGSGYTSLVHLRTLPADILKIDRAFINELDTVEGRSLMKLLIEAAHTLDLGVVAEGVETLQQLQRLEQLHCDEVQGYYLGRPMPVAEADSLFVSSLPSID